MASQARLLEEEGWSQRVLRVAGCHCAKVRVARVSEVPLGGFEQRRRVDRVDCSGRWSFLGSRYEVRVATRCYFLTFFFTVQIE